MASRLYQFNAKLNFPTQNTTRPFTRYGPPGIIAMAHSHSYWTTIESEIDTYLKKAIPIRQPKTVFEPMHHVTFAAPRTSAPALTIAACELVGGERAQAMVTAAAIHLMHAAAHAHEHLPLTDRPNPKSNAIDHKFGPNIELLTGDGMIPYGLELLARSMEMSETEPDKVLRVIIELSRLMGSQGMVDGQYHELGLDDDDYETIEYVSKKKEGELHACGAACGAILGGGAEEEIEKLRNFGMYLGMMQGLSGRKTKLGLKDNMDRLKGLALKELESVQGKKIEMVTWLLELDSVLTAV